ncbi:hypothetical protein F2Q70_00034322 [Brassica cretica]|uniref:DC1 domain-containing protein n=1 Tax=Brassica cretica TaxID=69181 RepID=A0A8S9JUK8_BRACR|nr:hypothetical protein F2Q70_00034322 [Brassica cretica]
MAGDRSPYSCQQCYFMIHQSCIDLPEIINVNRHEHRLSRRLHLSPGSWVCGFCHKNVDWSYGAYSCSICPNYVIHSKCAIRDDVWDKLELKGIPEEPQDIEPFKVIDENLICHFSHKEHYLQLNEEGIISGGSIRCEACVLPIYSQAFYSCVQCNFILHKTCANLSRKKRHFSHDKALTLICGDKIEHCEMCGKYSQGFKYTDFQYFSIDVKCAMLSESIIHESHPCTLYYNNNTYIKCASCNKEGYRSFSCDDCSFGLHGRCAALPKTIQHCQRNTASKSVSVVPQIEAKHHGDISLAPKKKMAASPIAVAMYSTLSVFTLTIGLVITAFFFISAMKLHHLGKTVASRFDLATAAKHLFSRDLDRCFCYLLVVFMSDPSSSILFPTRQN